MPKQVFINGVLQITEDVNDPQDRLKVAKKQNQGKDPKTLTDKEKVALFDAYVEAGRINLNE